MRRNRLPKLATQFSNQFAAVSLRLHSDRTYIHMYIRVYFNNQGIAELLIIDLWPGRLRNSRQNMRQSALNVPLPLHLQLQLHKSNRIESIRIESYRVLPNRIVNIGLRRRSRHLSANPHSLGLTHCPRRFGDLASRNWG